MAFSLFFGSQYHVLPLSCGDLFDVIFFCDVFVETDELWLYDQDIYEQYLNLL